MRFSLGESPHNSDSVETGSGSGRPVRAAVVNAAAITEAQNDIFSSVGRRFVYLNFFCEE